MGRSINNNHVVSWLTRGILERLKGGRNVTGTVSELLASFSHFFVSIWLLSDEQELCGTEMQRRTGAEL